MADQAVKRFPIIGACGLDCGLCPRYHTDGKSRCTGCAGEGYGGWGCPIQKCCVREHGLECCGQCPEAEGCPRLEKLLKEAATADSFISYASVPANIRAVRQDGIAETAARLSARTDFLTGLLAEYNDGRSKGFYCLAVQLLPLEELELIVRSQADTLAGGSRSERAAVLRQAFTGLASRMGLTLKLRNQKKEGKK